MSNAELSPDDTSNKPRLGIFQTVGIIAVAGHQALHGGSEAVSGRMLHDQFLTEMALGKTIVSVGAFAVGALYYRRHHLVPKTPIELETVEIEGQPLIPRQLRRGSRLQSKT